MPTSVTISTQSVPSGFCFTTWQESWVYLVSLLRGSLGTTAGFINYGPDTPSADSRDKPWFRTDDQYSPIRWYSYHHGLGVWVSKFYPDPNDQRRWPYTGSLASVDTLDGGTAGVATVTSGPFWEVDTAMEHRFLVGVGTFPDSSTTVDVNETGGSDEVVLTEAGIPIHDHGLPGASIPYYTTPGTGIDLITRGDNPNTAASAITDHSYGDGEGHNNLPPYYGVYWIKRTVREFYIV